MGQEQPSNGRDEAFCTLILSDDYVPGALVLAAQLRRLHTTRYRLVCLIGRNALQQRPPSLESLDALRESFDELVYVDTVDAGDSAELRLLSRPELRLAVTKLRLWELPFSRVIYLDADTLPVKPLDTLFRDVELPTSGHIGAAPDCGWPDLFNSGVLVIRPDVKLAESLIAAVNAQQQRSIDGSDQGLLNQLFTWVRLPFTYNVTVNASYEYLPAYRWFRDDVKVLHFIGSTKPWNQAPNASEWTARWWQAYNATSYATSLHAASTLAYNPDNVIEAPADFWDARTHAPFRKTRPEGEALAASLAGLSLAEQIERQSVGDTQDPQQGQRRRPRRGTAYPSDGQAARAAAASPGHVYPAYGPSIVALPFENSQTAPEREF